MIQTDVRHRIQCVSLSLTGKKHLSADKPNEDAFGCFFGKHYAVAALADGVGSCPHAFEGANSAVRIMAEAGKALEQRTLACTPSAVIRYILAQWQHMAAPQELAAYACTLKGCIIAEDSVILLSIGDGQLLAHDGSSCWAAPNMKGDFVNETSCLYLGLTQEAFWSRQLPLPQRLTVLMSSDGFADALQNGAEEPLMRYLHTANNLPALEKDLSSMGENISHYNADDKTVGVIYYGM